MKKTILFMGALLFTGVLNAQIWQVSESYVRFFSEAPMENIEAENEKVKGLMNTSSSEVAIIVPIASFEFEKELMKEHFNENYLETDKYKTGTFQGSIQEEVDWDGLTEQEVSCKGILDIHGVKKERTLEGKLVRKGDEISLESVFEVKLVDHDIEIPQVVFYNIAEVIEVTVKLKFTPKK